MSGSKLLSKEEHEINERGSVPLWIDSIWRFCSSEDSSSSFTWRIRTLLFYLFRFCSWAWKMVTVWGLCEFDCYGNGFGTCDVDSVYDWWWTVVMNPICVIVFCMNLLWSCWSFDCLFFEKSGKNYVVFFISFVWSVEERKNLGFELIGAAANDWCVSVWTVCAARVFSSVFLFSFLFAGFNLYH